MMRRIAFHRRSRSATENSGLGTGTAGFVSAAWADVFEAEPSGMAEMPAAIAEKLRNAARREIFSPDNFMELTSVLRQFTKLPPWRLSIAHCRPRRRPTAALIQSTVRGTHLRARQRRAARLPANRPQL